MVCRRRAKLLCPLSGLAPAASAVSPGVGVLEAPLTGTGPPMSGGTRPGDPESMRSHELRHLPRTGALPSGVVGGPSAASVAVVDTSISHHTRTTPGAGGVG